MSDDLIQDDAEEIPSEWQRHQIQEPVDDFDDDDEEDEFIAGVEARRKNRPNRGNGLFGTE